MKICVTERKNMSYNFYTKLLKVAKEGIIDKIKKTFEQEMYFTYVNKIYTQLI
jgi:hypothetical protein